MPTASADMPIALSGHSVPVLPNELLIQIVNFVDDRSTLAILLFVCKFTYRLVSPHVYTKAIFPDEGVTMTDIIRFCHQYGRSLKTIKLPQRRYYPDTFFSVLAQSCPNLIFLQSSATFPQLVHRLLPHLEQTTTCFMLTQASAGMGMDETTAADDDQPERLFDFYPFACCSCCFTVANSDLTSDVVTRIPHYYHHPGALRSAILPTFGPDLLSLTLNSYDILTATVAHMIISRCPRLRFLVAPAVKAEGLWMILRWCDTLAAVVVGIQDEEDLEQHHQQYISVDDENEKAVASVEHYKRVWCVHAHKAHFFGQIRKSWHIGIVPRK
ncbi:hypothetical protein BX666DRAFT_1942427 [Dichotomocladium elegans]|nr:hypothetical protein BX666DRAFT_1942427 [Dichotomocladium elegans]